MGTFHVKFAGSWNRKYRLVPSTKEEREVSGAMTAVEYRKGDLKHQIANVVRPALQDYRFRSFREFKALLGLFNVTVEEVRKSVDGRTCHGLVYAALDEKGRRCGVGIKSSYIGRSVGYEALKRKCARSKTWMKAHPVQESTKEAIREALRQDTRQGFLRLLAEKGVVPILWENEQGVIYGVTYIDHGSRTVFKGSALGREFSASVLNRLYGTPLPMTMPPWGCLLERGKGKRGNRTCGRAAGYPHDGIPSLSGRGNRGRPLRKEEKRNGNAAARISAKRGFQKIRHKQSITCENK